MAQKVETQRSLKLILILGLLLLLTSCSLIRQRKGAEYQPIVIDLTKDSGPFKGFGANVPISFYNRRTRPLQVLNDLNIRYVRVTRSADNWNDILALRAATHRLKIKWIYTLVEIPAPFVNAQGQLVDVDGFAAWWAEEVDELDYQEVPADLIELVERPDLNQQGYQVMDADTYGRLVHATRKELDLRDFQDVAIVGPGLASPDIHGERETWYMDLDQEAFNALQYWSVQAWEDSSGTVSAGAAISHLVSYQKSIESQKQVFVTSYGTHQTRFHGQQYPDPGRYDILGNQSGYERYYYNATFALPYGLKVFATTLELFAISEATPFIYQLYDAPDEVKFKKSSWGLLDLNGQEKPVYQLLATLLKEIPDKASIIPLQFRDDAMISGLAFRDDTRLIITLCNQQLVSRNIQLVLKAADRSLTFQNAIALDALETYPPDLGKMDTIKKTEVELKLRSSSELKANTCQYTIAPQSVLIATFQFK